MLKHIILVLTFAFIAQSSYAQSRITTVTGGIYVGTILSEDSKEILVRTTDSLEITIPREKIESVSYGKVMKNVTGGHSQIDVPAQNTVVYEPAPRPIFMRQDEPHWSFGAALGTPAGIQPVLGYHSGEWGVRASAMLIPDAVAGLQVGMMKRIATTGHLDINAMLISGFSVLDEGYPYYDQTWLYAGPALSLDLFGIYAEGGLTLGIGDFSNPQLAVQLGYAYHFY
jgi:hypothetical protein